MELAVMQESTRKHSNEVIYNKNEFMLAEDESYKNKFDIILGLFVTTRINIKSILTLANNNSHIYIPFYYSLMDYVYSFTESTGVGIDSNILTFPKLREQQVYPNEIRKLLTDSFKVLLIYKGNKVFEKPTKSTYWHECDETPENVTKSILNNYTLPNQSILDISDITGTTLKTASIKYWDSVSLPYTKKGEENCNKELRRIKLNVG